MMTCRRSRCGGLAFAAAALAVAAALAMPMFARSAAAYAAPAGPPTVVYDSAAREFFVRNADGGSLFDTLENLVPGDSSSHTVAVRVENARTPVALYLRPSCDRAVADVIGPVRVVMSADGRTLYDGEIGELLREGALPVKMAELSGGRSADFTLDVLVPVTLGNEAAGLENHVHWTLIAQDEGGSAGAGGSEGSEGEGGSGGSSGTCGAGTVEADVSTLTKTGDSPYALAALAAAVGAAAVLAAVFVRSRRGSR